MSLSKDDLRQKVEDQGRDLSFSMDYGDGDGGHSLVRSNRNVQKDPGRTSGTYELQKLRGRHHRIINMHVAGLSNKEIAERLDINPMTVSYTINSEIGQEQIQLLLGEIRNDQIDVQRRIRHLAPVAVEVLEEIMLEGDNDTDRRLAANSLLDRGGAPKTKNVNVRSGQLDDNEIDEITERGKQLAREAGLIEDVEYEDVTDQEKNESS